MGKSISRKIVYNSRFYEITVSKSFPVSSQRYGTVELQKNVDLAVHKLRLVFGEKQTNDKIQTQSQGLGDLLPSRRMSSESRACVCIEVKWFTVYLKQCSVYTGTQGINNAVETTMEHYRRTGFLKTTKTIRRKYSRQNSRTKRSDDYIYVCVWSVKHQTWDLPVSFVRTLLSFLILQLLCLNFTIEAYHLCLILSAHKLMKDITIIQELLWICSILCPK